MKARIVELEGSAEEILEYQKRTGNAEARTESPVVSDWQILDLNKSGTEFLSGLSANQTDFLKLLVKSGGEVSRTQVVAGTKLQGKKINGVLSTITRRCKRTGRGKYYLVGSYPWKNDHYYYLAKGTTETESDYIHSGNVTYLKQHLK